MTSTQSSRSFKQVIGTALADIAKVTVGAGVALYVLGGSLNVQRQVNFTPNGTTTGAVLQLNGVTRFQRFTVACTSTGGLELTTGGGAKYDTCITASPISTSGALLGLSLECGGVPKPYTGDFSFVKARGTGTGTALLDTVTAGSGSYTSTTLSSKVWNPADFLKFGTRTSVPNTSGDDCVMGIDMFDKYGS